MLPYYPFFWGDYIQKTAHLSQTQHGAYMLFLRHIYGTGELIEENQKYRIAMAFNEEERKAADYILQKFFSFSESGNYWDHLKCREVIAKADESHKSHVEKGSAGGRKKAERLAQLQNNSSPTTSPRDSSNSSTNSSNLNPKTQNLKTLNQKTPPLSPQIVNNFVNNSTESNKLTNEGEGEFLKLRFGEEKNNEELTTDQVLLQLGDKAFERARKNAPEWDIYYLVGVYIAGINDGIRQRPNSIKAAFPAWCLKYTKGKRP